MRLADRGCVRVYKLFILKSIYCGVEAAVFSSVMVIRATEINACGGCMCPFTKITSVTGMLATEREQVMRHNDKQLMEILTTSAGSS